MRFTISCLIGAAASIKTPITSGEGRTGTDIPDFDDVCATLEPNSQEQIDCYVLELCGPDCDFTDPCADLPETEQGQCYDDLLSEALSLSEVEDPCEGLEG